MLICAMFSNSFVILFALVVVLQSTMVAANLSSAPTTQKSVVTEPARNVVQLSTTCSAMVDKQTKLLFSKASGLYPELGKFLSTVGAKGKKELGRTCTNSRGDVMEYQNGEITSLRNLAVNHQMVIEKIKL